MREARRGREDEGGQSERGDRDVEDVCDGGDKKGEGGSVVSLGIFGLNAQKNEMRKLECR